MDDLGYLARLLVQLTIGAAQLPDEVQQRHGAYVLERQRADGGWAGREGESDIYYTSFALRSLAILGLLEGEPAQRCADFLQHRMQTQETLVDLLSLVYSAKLIEAACSLDSFQGAHAAWAERLAALLEQLRRPDGGYSKSLEGQAGSTYQTFLVLLCLELIEQPCPDAPAAQRFLLSQRQDDGGFLEIRVGKRSGTNPTAAAIGALRILGQLDEHTSRSAADFLLERQCDEGGFQANTRIPFPDLLSTFTACVTLADLDALGEISTKHAKQYAVSMQQTAGGFRGFEFDPADDIEYTFYGLGTLALLHTL
ncbi:MAG: terpene cyclase/mutase family protein [Planctomycetales bacterium]|nr:terpene cyclase/mutase family protein [Planctomycetales bacterium]